ncbi:MAG: SseB family protein [Armatimonadetes bacterium]|nr:SseB family protein [Armatimonadota bacterium]
MKLEASKEERLAGFTEELGHCEKTSDSVLIAVIPCQQCMDKGGNMPNRTSNDQVLEMLRNGSANDEKKAFFEALNNAVFVAPYWEKCGYPAPVAFTQKDGTTILPIYTHSRVLSEAIELTPEMWIDELSIREAYRWLQTNKWSKIVINYRSKSYIMDTEQLADFVNQQERVA